MSGKDAERQVPHPITVHSMCARGTAAEAVAEGPEQDPVADELMRLWDDLDKAIRYARNGAWSLDCEDKTGRIVQLTVHTGKPTHWKHIQMPLLEAGVYQAISDATGVPYEQPDMALVSELRAERDAVAGR